MNRLFSVIAGVVFLVLSSCSSPGNIFEASGDVGNCKLPGSMQYDKSTGIYTLTGAGTNMWGTADEFFMAWKQVSGDFTLSAKIAFEGEGVEAHRKMGLIIRGSLEGDAVYADVAVHGDGLTSLQYRQSKGVETEEFVSPNNAPGYVLLQRMGNKISIKTAVDTYPDATDAEVTLDLPPTCYVGLFVCSHNPDVIETGRFSLVELK
ncbi:MAG: hypothetical protein LBK45_03435 [Tannerellaceae bacterium]|jgi:hypothetical protein|nr:hypothetical protein [Tannerellaceae bacterium]